MPTHENPTNREIFCGLFSNSWRAWTVVGAALSLGSSVYVYFQAAKGVKLPPVTIPPEHILFWGPILFAVFVLIGAFQATKRTISEDRKRAAEKYLSTNRHVRAAMATAAIYNLILQADSIGTGDAERAREWMDSACRIARDHFKGDSCAAFEKKVGFADAVTWIKSASEPGNLENHLK